jgi:predicted ArsR family transcriptional regulator
MATYSDPRILRAVAHPTRNRILAELHAAGTLRAADIARVLDVPANQASFHLRQLAKYGLVEEAPEEGRDRRDRVWRLAGDGTISFKVAELRDQPGGEAAVELVELYSRSRGHLLVDTASAGEGEGRSSSESSLRLTAGEAEELAADLAEVVDRWRDRTAGAEGERATWSIFQLIQPWPNDPPGAPPREPFQVRGFGAP